jgi:hypothetical protein
VARRGPRIRTDKALVTAYLIEVYFAHLSIFCSDRSLQFETRLHFDLESWSICKNDAEPLLFDLMEDNQRTKSRDSENASRPIADQIS